ncbi:hypothetical protein ACLOJK_040168, partial [Asimina triloba]
IQKEQYEQCMEWCGKWTANFKVWLEKEKAHESEERGSKRGLVGMKLEEQNSPLPKLHRVVFKDAGKKDVKFEPLPKTVDPEKMVLTGPIMPFNMQEVSEEDFHNTSQRKLHLQGKYFVHCPDTSNIDAGGKAKVYAGDGKIHLQFLIYNISFLLCILM